MAIRLLFAAVVAAATYGCATPPDEAKTATDPAGNAEPTAKKSDYHTTGSRLPSYDYGSGAGSVSTTSRQGYEDERRGNTINPTSGR